MLKKNIFDIGKKVAKAVYKKLPGRFITEDNKIPRLTFKPKPSKKSSISDVVHIDPQKSVGDNPELLLRSRDRRPYGLVSRSEKSHNEIIKSLIDNEMAYRQSADRIAKEIAKRQLDDKRQSDDRADRKIKQLYEDLKASRKQVKKSKGGRKSTKKY